MDTEKLSELELRRAKFQSKAKTIRVRSLRRLLQIYFSTYVLKDQAVVRTETLKGGTYPPRGVRSPKTPPGLRIIQNTLRCSKTTAQDYLRAIYIIREIFVANEIMVHIRKKDYQDLRRALATGYDEIQKNLDLKQERRESIRQSLLSMAQKIDETSGVYTKEDVSRMFMEFANALV
jgi:hypothetical protein